MLDHTYTPPVSAPAPFAGLGKHGTRRNERKGERFAGIGQHCAIIFYDTHPNFICRAFYSQYVHHEIELSSDTVVRKPPAVPHALDQRADSSTTKAGLSDI
jgi:hypothetical protein